MTKTIVKYIVALPNLPFVIAMGVYVMYKIYKETGSADFFMYDGANFINDDIKLWMRKVYSNELKTLIAIVFYLWVLFKVLNF